MTAATDRVFEVWDRLVYEVGRTVLIGLAGLFALGVIWIAF